MKTLKEKIKVMQAALDGKEIEYKYPEGGEWHSTNNPLFKWVLFDYRIKPEPLEFWVNVYDNDGGVAHKTKEQAIQGHGGDKCKTIKVREVME